MSRPSLSRLRSPSDLPTPATMVVATRYVLDGWPVRVVVRDDGEGWRVLGSQMYCADDQRPASWQDLVELDPSLVTLPPLAPGTVAYRSGPGLPWAVCRG